MTVRDILQIGHPVLRQVAEDVDVADIKSDEIRTLIGDLVDTMRAANGAGIAANQIAVPLRVTVMEVTDNPRYPYKPRLPLTVVINPTIEFLTPAQVDDSDGPETVMINEGCLSVPLRGDVERQVNIRVRYYDGEGVLHDEVKRGLTAGTWQHECDHLDGVLFVDRVKDPASLSTWDEFNRNGRDAFIERITAFVEQIGS